MAWPPILVRYGEIGIKSRSVRLQFERKLVERIEEQLVRRAVECEVARELGRIVLRAVDVEAALDAARHTFGVVSASPAEDCAPTPDAVAQIALRVARERLEKGGSFAVRVKRSGIHAFTSLDVAKRCAEVILDELADRAPRVDLTAPDLEVHAEVREGHAFVFLRTVRGPGGLPLGSQGRVAILVDGPRAAHAAWLMAKRGSLPFFYSTRPDEAQAWLAPLARWGIEARAWPVAGEDRLQVYLHLQRAMREHRLQALVVADGAAEAVSRAAEDRSLGFPVFRPLVGFAGPRFEALAREAELPAEAA